MRFVAGTLWLGVAGLLFVVAVMSSALGAEVLIIDAGLAGLGIALWIGGRSGRIAAVIGALGALAGLLILPQVLAATCVAGCPGNWPILALTWAAACGALLLFDVLAFREIGQAR
jgi:hypothetical protein